MMPDHAVMPAYGYALLCADTLLVKAVYPGIDNVYGNLAFNLNNNGECLTLYDAAGQIADSLAFDDVQPWPVEADGEGYTLELIDPSLDNSLPHSWTASSAIGGTPGRSNSRATLVPLETAAQPSQVELMENYPNPFNSMTRIRYALPGAGQTTLAIYDVLGRSVATLVEKHQMPGAYEALWKADVASGIYFYRLTCAHEKGREIIVKKMLLLK